MKRLAILAGALALGLGACGQNNGLNIGQGFGMDANISGGSVAVAITTTKNAAGQITAVSSLATVTEPTVVFNARPQSVGFQLQKYTVEVLDNAGGRYAADQGLYQRSASAIIAPGLVCTPSSVSLDNCLPSAKQASNVATPVNGLTLIIDEVARQIAADCVANQCPTLKMKVTFTGVDDSGRPQSVVVAGVNLSASVSTSN